MTAILKISAGAVEPAARTNRPVLTGFVVTFFCAALLAGPAYDSYLHYDFSHSKDSESYMQMASGNFDVCVTHKYRVIVPGLAKLASLPVQTVFGIVWPHRDDAAFHLRLGFFLINLTFMSLLGFVLFRTCQAYGFSVTECALAVTGVLVSRWANCLASIPLVDSFHLLCVALLFLALKTRDSRLLALAIVLGPLSKESFLLIAPITMLFGSMRLWVQLVLYASAGLLILATHSLIDLQFPGAGTGSVQNAFDHFQKVPISLRRLASPGGLGEVFTVLGLFNVVWLLTLLRPSRRELLGTIDLPLWCLLGSVIVQALISTSLARMLFVAAPFWAVLLAKGFQLLLADSLSIKTNNRTEISPAPALSIREAS